MSDILDLTLRDFFAMAERVGEASRVIRDAQAMLGAKPIQYDYRDVAATQEGETLEEGRARGLATRPFSSRAHAAEIASRLGIRMEDGESSEAFARRLDAEMSRGHNRQIMDDMRPDVVMRLPAQVPPGVLRSTPQPNPLAGDVPEGLRAGGKTGVEIIAERQREEIARRTGVVLDPKLGIVDAEAQAMKARLKLDREQAEREALAKLTPEQRKEFES